MKIIHFGKEMQQTAHALHGQGKRIGCVPTMGFLHAGHLSLVKLARERSDVVILTLFVNPTQFGPQEDLAKYPRNFERDAALCREAGVDILFAPEAPEMYAADASIYVVEEKLSRGLCGASRLGHFRGVCTVVAKLFNLCMPHVAVFGEKDAQQFRIIRRMTRDLNFPVEIVSGPTLREADGLAMSSRNTYLSADERQQALVLKRALDETARLFRAGWRDATALKTAMQKIITQAPAAKIDYIEIVDDETLEPVQTLRKPALVALAVFIGKTRLIDNIVLKA
ncbi:MAG: pantoate--beta-alanine ligase [Verrucomicrobia bacterium]|nr:MAG: pantoate--beta-alanine ligase [Verrucomicrobiota bacterium]